MSRKNKYTYDQIKYFVEVETNSGCKLLSKEYKNYTSNMEFECKCGNIFITNFTCFKDANKRQCNICGQLSRINKHKIDYSEVKNFIEGNEGKNCKLITPQEEYIDTKNSLTIKCECENIFNVSFFEFKTGNCRRCHDCVSISKRRTHDEFIKEVYNLVGDEYEVLNEYVSFKYKIKMKHNICGNVWDVDPYHFLRKQNGSRCPICSRENGHKKTIKTNKEYKQEVYNLVGDEYTLLEEYKNCGVKIKFRHNCDICDNNEFYMRPTNFLCGSRCPKCFVISITKTHEQFYQEIYNLVEDEYTLLSQYINNNEKVRMRHKICNSEYDVTPYNFLNGKRCPVCNMSHGEQKIEKYLKNKNITYFRQYKFDNCKNKFSLPFDFAIFNNDKMYLLIEYDGEQHFRPITFRGMSKEQAYKNYLLTLKRDNIKNDFCQNNNISLLRIPYWDFNNVELILDIEFNKYIKVIGA